jgi:hypothetical protein
MKAPWERLSYSSLPHAQVNAPPVQVVELTACTTGQSFFASIVFPLPCSLLNCFPPLSATTAHGPKRKKRVIPKRRFAARENLLFI